MLPGANNCGRISDDRRSDPRSLPSGGFAVLRHTAVMRQIRNIAIVVPLVLGAVALLQSGCSSSSPRFRSGETSARSNDEDEARFAPKIREEERKEDDRKVDLSTIRRKYAAGNSPYTNKTPDGIDRDRVLLEVVSFLGVPYRYGGTSMEGIDCSGFSSRVYADATKQAIPRSTVEQFRVGKEIDKDDLQFGDLVFFNTTGRRPSHVGIYIEDDLFAHASVLSGVTISSLESTYYRKRYVGARRMVGE